MLLHKPLQANPVDGRILLAPADAFRQPRPLRCMHVCLSAAGLQVLYTSSGLSVLLGMGQAFSQLILRRAVGRPLDGLARASAGKWLTSM